MISNSGHDENGKYSGGKAGDQTGKEWCIQPWYNRPWTVVLRHPDPEVRKMISELAQEAAANDLIGYDQGCRYTFWEELKLASYRPRFISHACEADCSAGVTAIVKAVGYLLQLVLLMAVSIYCYTGNLKSALVKAGFKALTDEKYLKNDKELLEGDILLCENHHVAINVTENAAPETWYESEIGTGEKGLKVLTEGTAVRTGPSTNHKQTGELHVGERVYATGKAYYKNKWWVHTTLGWISMVNLSGWIYENSKWWYLTEERKYSYYAGVVAEIDGKDYAFDREGWMITSDRITDTGALKEVE